ncbi:hypothetical protein GLOIN_2v1486306 [Rhizophagus clarus]|uniref:Uncharacterized protein n=1 Tax=Rhizophagus clarus TaxID=94130 RepID=A0A8H3LPS9_9GLOM|nr:hypothetical protein GLOIN_2v1486306 [Rhizophagus clarus]
MGHFKKAVDYSLEDNDQQSLDDIILAYISEKQAKWQAMAIKNLTRHNCKGRSTTKRMKGHNEENNNVSTSKA